MKTINSKGDNKVLGTLPPVYKQSANSVFHFMKKPEYLLDVLSKKKISPRYNVEEAEHYGISGLYNIAFPMICFCDIKLHRVFEHAEYYGNYAIAFSKEFSINHRIQPITYINEQSELFSKIKSSLKTAYDMVEKDSSNEFECFSDAAVYSMAFMKRLSGIQDGKEKNFHDEQEWRYVPDFSKHEIQLFLVNTELEKDLLKNYNDTLAELDDVSIRFEYNDVKYIVVEKESDREICINTIMKSSECDHDKLILVSRIITFDDIRGDM